MLYLAIDQHRKQLTVNLRSEVGDAILKRQVSTHWERVQEFLEEIRRQSQPEGGFVAILEVCGFNDWLLKLLKEYGCHETILVQPGGIETDTMKEPGSPRKVRLGTVRNPSSPFQETPECYTSVSTSTSVS